MYHEQLKHLWRMRFKKIYETEKDSFRFYRELLRRNKTLLHNSRAKELLKKLMHEEIQHARIARELLRLVDKRVELKQPELDLNSRTEKHP